MGCYYREDRSSTSEVERFNNSHRLPRSCSDLDIRPPSASAPSSSSWDSCCCCCCCCRLLLSCRLLLRLLLSSSSTQRHARTLLYSVYQKRRAATTFVLSLCVSTATCLLTTFFKVFLKSTCSSIFALIKRAPLHANLCAHYSTLSLCPLKKTTFEQL